MQIHVKGLSTRARGNKSLSNKIKLKQMSSFVSRAKAPHANNTVKMMKLMSKQPARAE